MTGPGWVDSHCHLPTCADPPSALTRARRAGVKGLVVVGTDLPTSHHAVELADRHHDVVASVGLHPHEASKLGAEWGQLEALARSDGAVAIGEAGLDLHYEHSPRDEQETAFRWQIRLAKDTVKTLVIHSREAWDDTFRVLEDEGPPPRLVFHCFTGGAREAARALDLGAHLSFSGILTFPNADDVRDAAARAPLDRCLVETDAPYLAPVPHRGRENEPANVALVGAALAAAQGRPVVEVAERVRANAAGLFPGLTPG